MYDVDDICDYVIARLRAAGVHINLLKLHKLLYYVQAWALAYDNEPMFDEDFQAWVHGPVSRRIFDRFKESKSLYSSVGVQDIREGFDAGSLREATVNNINSVLDVYGGFSGDQLEQLTHEEQPWLEARANLSPTERSTEVISQETMGSFYRARLS
ncbi:hypothetical protein GCM10007853_29880 [Algimonas ampicilliniresistens]|uniref:Antitoxin SocA-like Panacea domain-containing protein n=1 Tax=Algimonas ampicilliniresistens TaxID=1298735 RepID=A0ABQ5VC88_9PROT|nr:type II toxin-antitoxin system antitoxin SocA domain-containing protein [Algimonas ampicilliniresistens]GLQ25114.1 hypothetical protein GCM10007853_29880 [Algimonas ampicilliniresistens]